MKALDSERKVIAKEILWNHLREKKFKRDEIFGAFKTDFVNKRKKIIIEVEDGRARTKDNYVSLKDRWFYDNGYEILRVEANDVLNNIDMVKKVIESCFN